MRVEIKDPKFEELAVELKTTPEKLVEALINHAKHMSVHARNDIINGKPLENVFSDLFENALPGLILNDVIRDIVGEHDYIIDDGDYSREKGIIWVQVSFLEGTNLNMGSVTLQFGKDPGIVALEFIDSIETRYDLDEIAHEIEEELSDTDPTFDLEHGDSVSLEDDGENIVITMQINWKDEFDLPRVAEIDVIMKRIKEKILSSA